MSRDMVERIRTRARASKAAVIAAADDIEAAVKKMRPPLMRRPPADAGGITPKAFSGVIDRATNQ
jgi:hypothetical protein